MAWLQESQNANKQDLRIFNFVSVTAAVLVALGLVLAFHAPARRDWLPRETQTILTVEVSRFTDADFTRALQMQEPDTWQAVWSGLLRKAAEVPEIDVRRRVLRITRAFAPSSTPGGPPVDYLLVEMREASDVETLFAGLPTHGFGHRVVNNLPIFEDRSGVAIAQVGPDTVALGSTAAVEELIRVRLGLPGSDDLKSDAQFFSEFQRLDNDSAFRLVTYQPRELMMGLTNPVLNARTPRRVPDPRNDSRHARAGIRRDSSQCRELPGRGADGAHDRGAAGPGAPARGSGAQSVHRTAHGATERQAGGMAFSHDGAGGAGVLATRVAPRDARSR